MIRSRGSEVKRNGMPTGCNSSIWLMLTNDVEKVVQEFGRTYALEMLVQASRAVNFKFANLGVDS
jgi:hypothetical protein